MNACSLSVDTFANNLDKAIRTNDDPTTISQALPAYILLIDSMIESNPEDESSLKASADLLNAYSGLISIEAEISASDEETQRNEERLRILTQKSLNRASEAICIYENRYCGIISSNYEGLVKILNKAEEEDIAYLFSLAQSWTGKLQANREDWNLTAKIPHIKMILKTVVKLDNNWQQGSAYMYLGVLNSLIPAALGGKPEIGKSYFETAIEVSNQNNMMAKVLYAEYYGRLTFNQNLHNSLLEEVIKNENSNKEFGLMNTLAKLKAKQLLKSGSDYF